MSRRPYAPPAIEHSAPFGSAELARLEARERYRVELAPGLTREVLALDAAARTELVRAGAAFAFAALTAAGRKAPRRPSARARRDARRRLRR